MARDVMSLRHAICTRVCSEKVLSPLLVLLLHFLLVADVSYHRRELWQGISVYYCSIRLLVATTVALYLGTSCSDPGYLDGEPTPWLLLCCLFARPKSHVEPCDANLLGAVTLEEKAEEKETLLANQNF